MSHIHVLLTTERKSPVKCSRFFEVDVIASVNHVTLDTRPCDYSSCNRKSRGPGNEPTLHVHTCTVTCKLVSYELVSSEPLVPLVVCVSSSQKLRRIRRGVLQPPSPLVLPREDGERRGRGLKATSGTTCVQKQVPVFRGGGTTCYMSVCLSVWPWVDNSADARSCLG